MKTKAAILWGLNQRWEIEEVELDGPKRDEVTVKLVASGLCHSDHHLVTGDIPRPFPVVAILPIEPSRSRDYVVCTAAIQQIRAARPLI